MVSQHQIHHLVQKHLSHEQPQQPKRSKEVIVPTNLFLISSHACTMALKCTSLNVFRFLGTGAFSRLLSRSLESLSWITHWRNRDGSDLELHRFIFVFLIRRAFDLIGNFIIDLCLPLSINLSLIFLSFFFFFFFYLYLLLGRNLLRDFLSLFFS